MFFLFQLLENIELVEGVQTNRDYSLLLFIKCILLFAKTDNFSLSLLLRYLGSFFFIPEYLLFCFKGFLFENFRYSIDLANIISLALTNILGISSIFYITRGDILLFVLFIANTRNYVSFSGFSYYITKGNRITIITFR
jgi:hypothetical protein